MIENSKESYYRRYTNSYEYLPFSSEEEAAPGTATIYGRNGTFEIPFRRLTLAWDASDVHSDGYGFNGLRADNTVYSRTNKPTYKESFYKLKNPQLRPIFAIG